MTAFLFGLALLLGGTASSPMTNGRAPVRVSLVGDDGLTNKLRDSLELAIEQRRHLRVASSDENPALAIVSESNVDWEKLAGRVVVIYTVYVSSEEAKHVRLTGACFDNDIDKCANDIVERSSRFIAK
jgi:hypothetical protein